MVGYRKDLVGRMINEYKYKYIRAFSRPLAEMMADILPELPEDTVIVPLPTVARHVRERGFDHIGLIARQLARLKGWRVEKNLRRAEDTVQVGASGKQRREQAKKAYQVHGVVSGDKNYLVIDDVWTTGASMEAACRLLRAAGAKKIDVAILARHRRTD